MRRWGSIALSLVCSAPARAQAPPPELVRVGREGPSPPERAPPALAVPPPDLEPPALSEQVWRWQLRRLKIQTAVSWTFAAIGLAGLVVPIAILSRCPEDGGLDRCPHGREALIAAPIFGTLALASLIPAIIYTDRLVYHQRPERAPQLKMSAGGLVLRF